MSFGVPGLGGLAEYPYLLASGLLLVIFAVLFWIGREHRTLMIFAGLGSAVFSFSSIAFVPEYWNPIRLTGHIVGLEDLVFSFANGGTVWFLATRPVHRQLDLSFCPARFLKRFLAWTLAGVIITAPGGIMGMDPMDNCLIAMVLMGTVLLAINRRNWGMAAMGGLGFLLVYGAVLVLVNTFIPQFAAQWTHERLWGITLFRLPLEEFAWALGFGAVFSLILAHCADAQVLADRCCPA